MKKAGLVVLVLTGFVAGIAFVYNCGGGDGSNAIAQTDGYVSVSFISGWSRDENPEALSVENVWYIDQPEQWANADTSVSWEGRMSSAMDTSRPSAVYVPIQLPDGATITEFQLVCYDEKDDDIGVSAELRRSLSFGKHFSFVSVESTGSSNLPQYVTNSIIDPDFAVVDNSLYSYHIRGNVFGGGTDTVLISAMVKYELP